MFTFSPVSSESLSLMPMVLAEEKPSSLEAARRHISVMLRLGPTNPTHVVRANSATKRLLPVRHLGLYSSYPLSSCWRQHLDDVIGR